MQFSTIAAEGPKYNGTIPGSVFIQSVPVPKAYTPIQN